MATDNVIPFPAARQRERRLLRAPAVQRELERTQPFDARGRRLRRGEPQMYLALPSFPNVIVSADWETEYWLEQRDDGSRSPLFATYTTRMRRSDRLVALRYEGWPDELHAAGIVTEAMWRVRPGKGHSHQDANGSRVRIARRWRVKDGQPREYFVVCRTIDVSELPRWPAAQEALAAWQRWEKWYREWIGSPA
jgi:hypothetical protein